LTLKGLLTAPPAVEQKTTLLELCKMMVGLRNSWSAPRVAEGAEPYETDGVPAGGSTVFYHETMDRYKVSASWYE